MNDSVSPEPIDPQLLELLRCPKTRNRLRVASAAEVERVNAVIASGSCRDASGEPVVEPMEWALVTECGNWLYAIRQRIPALVPEEAIDLNTNSK